MKRITAIILLALMSMLVFTGCKREGEMIETMVSSIFSTDAPTQNNGTESKGQVTDSDGHIGNENAENSTISDTTGSTETFNTTDNNIL